MQVQPTNRLRIAALIYSMVNAVLFGAGLILVVTLPQLNENAGFWIFVVVVASLILAAPLAWMIAPRLQARYGRPRDTDRMLPDGPATTRG